jgi:hypothetical protein
MVARRFPRSARIPRAAVSSRSLQVLTGGENRVETPVSSLGPETGHPGGGRARAREERRPGEEGLGPQAPRSPGGTRTGGASPVLRRY